MVRSRGLSPVHLVGGTMVMVLVMASAGWARQGAPAPASLETRVQRLEDVEAIRTVLVDYGRWLDTRELSNYANLFARDGEWVGGFGTVKGRDNIEAFMRKNLGEGSGNGSYHLMSNFVIDVQGNSATALSHWTVIVPGSDGRPTASQSGRYEDRLVREDGRWKFQRRFVHNDMPQRRPRS